MSPGVSSYVYGGASPVVNADPSGLLQMNCLYNTNGSSLWSSLCEGICIIWNFITGNGNKLGGGYAPGEIDAILLRSQAAFEAGINAYNNAQGALAVRYITESTGGSKGGSGGSSSSGGGGVLDKRTVSDATSIQPADKLPVNYNESQVGIRETTPEDRRNEQMMNGKIPLLNPESWFVNFIFGSRTFRVGNTNYIVNRQGYLTKEVAPLFACYA